MTSRITIGIFVGGKGSRMGGVAKGLLSAPNGDETLIARLQRHCTQAAPNAALYLVGQAAPYAALGLPHLHDDPVDVGPIGGLRALLLRAQADHSELALALACDLPFIDFRVIAELLLPLSAAARVPFAEARLQPLAAAYAPTATLSAVDRALALNQHALMRVLDQLGPAMERIDFDDERARTLRDWDTPEDIQR